MRSSGGTSSTNGSVRSYHPATATTDAQRRAKAEAMARRSFRTLEHESGTDLSDELFSVIHGRWMATERAVVLLREGALAPPP